jgi:hypothetical protein
MSFKESLKGIGRMLLAVLAGAVGVLLLVVGLKGKESPGLKEVGIDRDKIREDARKGVMDSSSSDFIDEFPAVGNAAGRGKRRFTERVKGVLQQRGSDRNSRGNNEDSGRGDRKDVR